MGCLRCQREPHPDSPSVLKEGWLCYDKDGQCLRVNPRPVREWFRKKLCQWFGHRWKETVNRAISWAHVFHRRECLRCRIVEEEVTEHVYSN